MTEATHQVTNDNINISVVMPVFNEKATIRKIIRKVKMVNIKNELIIVDDFSNDGTREILKTFEGKEGIKIFYHNKNMGKGAALRTGFKNSNSEIIIIQDADLEYNPEEYGNLLAPILDGRADVVYGSRFLGGPHRVHLFWHYLGNKLLTLISNIFTNLNLTDMETCYKMFRAQMIKDVKLVSNRFGIEPELTALFAKRNARVYELPISYSGRDYAEGKKIGWKDGFAALYWIVKSNVFNKQIFEIK